MQTIFYILPELFLSLAIISILMLGIFIKKSLKLVNLFSGSLKLKKLTRNSICRELQKKTEMIKNWDTVRVVIMEYMIMIMRCGE